MKVSPINFGNRRIIKPTKEVKVGAHSAANAAGVLGTSTALSWLTSPKTMNKVVDNCGGMGKYTKKYIMAITAISLICGVSSALVCKLTDKIISKKPPKAVN